MKQSSDSDYSELPEQMRLPVKICESEFQQLFQSSPLLSLHARFAFQTLRKLGEGGMGSVYQVRDLRFDRVAALKLLKDKSATEHARIRFLREAKITARLDHPAIPPVHEIGLTADGDLYMLMRMIRGKTLSEVIRECHDLGKLARRVLVEILVKVAEAVAYAHSQGVIHRDLKPDNIMVGEFGEVLVIDWGIAKDLKVIESTQTDKILECVLSKSDLEQVGVTVTGTMVGTPGYMAPEQIDGVNIDERADVFSLGLILVEVLTGKQAISGNTTIELVTATASGSAMSPRDLDSSLSKEIDWIAREALELDLKDRTEGADELVDQLRAYLNGEEIPGYSYSLIERVQRTVKRRPGLIVATTVGALLLALIGNLWLTLELEGQKRKEAEKDVVVAKTKLGVAEDEAERAKAVLDLFNDARNLVERGAPQQRLKGKIDEALKRGGRTESQLLTAAGIYSDASFDAASKDLLEEAVKRYPPCYEGLFSLHTRELKLLGGEFYFTSYLERLREESKKRGQENEFTLFADAYDLAVSGKLDKSIATYSRIEEYSISFLFMYINRGVAWEKKGELDKALSDYNRAIELNPQSAIALINRGAVWKKKGDLNKALVDFNKAIKISPRLAPAYSGRGQVWDRKGELDKALSDYGIALELNPNEAISFYNRGILWDRKGDFDKALTDYNAAIKLDPKHAATFTNRGVIWERRGDSEKALADYNRAIKLDPREAFAFINRAVIWNKRGQLDNAIADYNNAIHINSGYAVFFKNRGHIWEKKGELDKALADYNKAIEIDPRYTAAYINRGVVRDKKGDFDKAIADYTRVIEINPNEVVAFNNRGILWNKKGDFDKALADHTRAIEIDPKCSSAFYQRGLAWGKKGRQAKALRDISKAIALKHENPLAYYVRGHVYFSRGKAKEACADFESFLGLVPNHPQAGRARRLLAQARTQLRK